MFNRNIFSQRLLQIRNSNNIMAKDVAKELGLTKSAISQLENSVTTPEVSNLIQLADFFDVSLDYLVGRTDNPNAHKK